MAKYTYLCKTCDEKFSTECKMAEYQSKNECPVCNGLSDRDTNDLLPQNYVWKCNGAYVKKS